MEVHYTVKKATPYPRWKIVGMVLAAVTAIDLLCLAVVSPGVVAASGHGMVMEKHSGKPPYVMLDSGERISVLFPLEAEINAGDRLEKEAGSPYYRVNGQKINPLVGYALRMFLALCMLPVAVGGGLVALAYAQPKKPASKDGDPSSQAPSPTA